ncbi:MAG: XRE family transcriptional regulator [Pseudomonadota bacterium]
MTEKKKQNQATKPYKTSSSAPVDDAKSTLEKSIGKTIQRLRKQKDLSISELAAASSLSIGMLSKVESGQTSASLGTIQKISNALSVPMSQLFADYDERRDCSFVPANKGVIIDRSGTKAGHRYQLLGATISGDIALEPYMIRLERDAQPYTNFQHRGVEFIHLLNGTMTYQHAAREYEMSPGDSLLFDAASSHGPKCISNEPAEFISVIVYQR